MHSLSVAFAALSAFAALGVSQNIDPNSVPLGTRQYWCTSQIASCPLICTQETASDNGGSAATISNSCDAATLDYSCVCVNGLTPNVSEYSQTVPYFECTEAGTQCVANCGMNNNACAASCTQDHPCGAQNPTRVNTTSTASGTASATGTGASGTGSAVYNGFGSSATSSSSSGSSGSSGSSSGASRAIMNVGQVYGMGIVLTGVFAGFALLL